MADRFKFMKLNAPADCYCEMTFGFNIHYSIDKFLEKINIPHLFENVAYWQAAQFRFDVHGVDDDHNFVDEVFDIFIEPKNYTLAQLPDALVEGFRDVCKYYFDNARIPQVSKMTISFA